LNARGAEFAHLRRVLDDRDTEISNVRGERKEREKEIGELRARLDAQDAGTAALVRVLDAHAAALDASRGPPTPGNELPAPVARDGGGLSGPPLGCGADAIGEFAIVAQRLAAQALAHKELGEWALCQVLAASPSGTPTEARGDDDQALIT